MNGLFTFLSALIVLTGLAPTGLTEEAKAVNSPAFEVRHFIAEEVVNRVGDTAVVQAVIINSGGEKANNVTVSLRGYGPEKTIAELYPGDSVRLTWEMHPTAAGPEQAELDIRCGDIHETAETTLLWHPSVDVEPADYVPEPQPVRGEFDVGVYYFPGWHTYGRWTVLDEFPERRPVLGYYREGNPEVADWHIKWMVEHGITFIIYDWYWSAGERQLEHALHDGFFNARYREMIDFCLLWANHNPPGTSSFEDMEAVTEYWLDNYFLRPEYLKVDGKPVMIIFSPYRLTEDLGGPEAVRKALDRSREMARERDLPGIYYMACVWPNEDHIRTIEQEGYDALTGYNYPTAGDGGQLRAPYADMVTGYQEFWEAIDDMSSIPYVPVTEPGWDSRPWHGPDARVRTGKTPELFKTMLKNAKQFVQERTPDADPKMVLIEAWNEFGEGDYIEPHREFGFQYLDVIREVFTTAPSGNLQLVPQDLGLGTYEIIKPERLTAWDFSDPNNPGWEARRQLRDARVADGLMTAVSIGDDPNFHCSFVRIEAEKFPEVEIRMSVDRGTMGQLFWHEPGMGFAEETSKRFVMNSDGEFHTYRLDLASSTEWAGEIVGLRFDPTEMRDALIKIDYIRFIPADEL